MPSDSSRLGGGVGVVGEEEDVRAKRDRMHRA